MLAMPHGAGSMRSGGVFSIPLMARLSLRVRRHLLNDSNSLGSQTGYATRMSAKMRVGLVVKV